MISWNIFPAIVRVSDQRLEADMARAQRGKDNYYLPLVNGTKENSNGFSFIWQEIVLRGKK